MSETENVDFAKYEWQVPSTRFGYLFYLIGSWIASFAFSTRNFLPPYGHNFLLGINNLSHSKMLEITKKTWLIEIVKTVGIVDESLYSSLEYHWRRISDYNRIGMAMGLFFGIGIFAGITFSSMEFLDLGEFAFTVITMVMLWIVVQVSKRLFTSIFDRYYADSLVVVGGLYFMIELLRKDAIKLPSSRRRLQNKLDQLAQNILLHSYKFRSRSIEDNQWIYSHIKGMERYVRDHERLIVAPKADSLDVLRQDFYHLLKILISGNYGEFNYEFQPNPEAQPSVSNRVVGAILGFTGFILPSLLLYGIYYNPQRIIDMGINVNTVTLVALAWLLLTIDATLKLGIVERITGLAKSIRDLG